MDAWWTIAMEPWMVKTVQDVPTTKFLRPLYQEHRRSAIRNTSQNPATFDITNHQHHLSRKLSSFLPYLEIPHNFNSTSIKSHNGIPTTTSSLPRRPLIHHGRSSSLCRRRQHEEIANQSAAENTETVLTNHSQVVVLKHPIHIHSIFNGYGFFCQGANARWCLCNSI